MNFNIENHFLDKIFLLLTDSYILLPFIVIALIYFHLKKNNKGNEIVKFIIPLILAVMLTTLLTTGIKEMIHEDRPCKTKTYYVYCKESSSFPSRHTAIVFSVIPFVLFNRKFFIILFFYACMVGIGMIYLGLHYPHDVLIGMIIGFSIGILFALNQYKIFKWLRKIKKKRR